MAKKKKSFSQKIRIQHLSAASGASTGKKHKKSTSAKKDVFKVTKSKNVAKPVSRLLKKNLLHVQGKNEAISKNNEQFRNIEKNLTAQNNQDSMNTESKKFSIQTQGSKNVTMTEIDSAAALFQIL